VYLLVVIVMVSTGICYTLAKRKGLSTQLWVILGAFFGPFAIPFLLLARPGTNRSR